MVFPAADNPTGPVYVDGAVARLLEGAEAATSRAFCAAARRVYPDREIRDIECAGGVGLFFGPSDPLNAVKGVGLRGAVSAAEWDAVEAAFAGSGSPGVVDLCPLAEEGVVAVLGGGEEASAGAEGGGFGGGGVGGGGGVAPPGGRGCGWLSGRGGGGGGMRSGRSRRCCVGAWMWMGSMGRWGAAW